MCACALSERPGWILTCYCLACYAGPPAGSRARDNSQAVDRAERERTEDQGIFGGLPSPILSYKEVAAAALKLTRV